MLYFYVNTLNKSLKFNKCITIGISTLLIVYLLISLSLDFIVEPLEIYLCEIHNKKEAHDMLLRRII